MPWCDQCARFLTPTSMGTTGECPSCGRVLAPLARTPWHFKLLILATTVYLGWRLVQGVVWLAHRI